MLVTELVVKKTIRKTEFLKGEGIGGSVFPIPFSPLYYWFYKYLCGWKCYLSAGFFVFLMCRFAREAAASAWMLVAVALPGSRGSLGGCSSRCAAGYPQMLFVIKPGFSVDALRRTVTDGVDT